MLPSPPASSASIGMGLRLGLAAREFGTKVLANWAGRRVGLLVQGSGVAGLAAGSIVQAAGVCCSIWRAGRLVTQGLHGRPEGVALTRRTVAVLAPAALIAAPIAWRLASTMAPVVLVALLPKLIERALRDLGDAHLSTALPGLDVVDRQGRVLPRDELVAVDQARTELVSGASLVLHTSYELTIRCLGLGGWTSMLAAGAVEGLRVFAGSFAIEAAAREQGLQVQERPGGGPARLCRNLASVQAWQQMADSLSIRETLGLLRDGLDVWVGTPASGVGVAACALLRAQAKTVAELRTLLLTLNKAAMAQGSGAGGALAEVEFRTLHPTVPANDAVVIHVRTRAAGPQLTIEL